MKRLTQILAGGMAAALTLGLVLVATAAPPPHAAPTTLTFEKCWDPDTDLWIGTVAGECGPGSVVYTTIVLEPAPSGVRLEGWYAITTDTVSFTAHCSGQANTHNGKIVLTGVVTADSANFAGARVQVRAELRHGGACSAGTITLTPTE
jgi:hypothetical protein